MCNILQVRSELYLFVFLQVHEAFWSPVSPTPTGTEPYLVAYSQEMAEELGIDPAEVTKPQFAATFTGNSPIPGSSTQTYAMRYGGHQFGSWAGIHKDSTVACCCSMQYEHTISNMLSLNFARPGRVMTPELYFTLKHIGCSIEQNYNGSCLKFMWRNRLCPRISPSCPGRVTATSVITSCMPPLPPPVLPSPSRS